jgi:hypothetical protein
MNIRAHTTLVGIFPVISHVGMAIPRTLGFRTNEFAGRFTLPFEAAWGEIVLVPGEYALYYGAMGEGLHCVEILGTGQSTPRGIFVVKEQNPASVVQNALVCTWRGDRRVIRTLELPAIGKSVTFTDPATGNSRKNRPGAIGTQVAGTPV